MKPSEFDHEGGWVIVKCSGKKVSRPVTSAHNFGACHSSVMLHYRNRRGIKTSLSVPRKYINKRGLHLAKFAHAHGLIVMPASEPEFSRYLKEQLEEARRIAKLDAGRRSTAVKSF